MVLVFKRLNIVFSRKHMFLPKPVLFFIMKTQEGLDWFEILREILLHLRSGECPRNDSCQMRSCKRISRIRSQYWISHFGIFDPLSLALCNSAMSVAIFSLSKHLLAWRIRVSWLKIPFLFRSSNCFLPWFPFTQAYNYT